MSVGKLKKQILIIIKEELNKMTEINKTIEDMTGDKNVMAWGTQLDFKCDREYNEYIKTVSHRRCDGGCNNIDNCLESKRQCECEDND